MTSSLGDRNEVTEVAWLTGFAYPWFFCVLIAPIVLLVLYARGRMRARRALRRYATADLEAAAVTGRRHRLRHLPIALYVVGLVLLTVALAGPIRDIRVPRNRAVVMLAIDVSRSMQSADVAPTRLAAAATAAGHYATRLTPGVNLGVVVFSGNAELLVSPTPDHDATVRALDHLRSDDGTATGEGIFAALQAISTVSAVLDGGGAATPAAQIVLLSDGEENRPSDPNDPRGAITAARIAKTRGIPISTIAFGTPSGYVDMGGERIAVPVDGTLMDQVATASGGRAFGATNADELAAGYAAVSEQLGYETRRGPGTTWWLYLGVLACACGVLASLGIHRRAPV